MVTNYVTLTKGFFCQRNIHVGLLTLMGIQDKLISSSDDHCNFQKKHKSGEKYIRNVSGKLVAYYDGGAQSVSSGPVTHLPSLCTVLTGHQITKF